MTHGTFESIVSTAVELQVMALGAGFGLLLALLWGRYQQAAVFLLGFALAMVVGQTLTPWAPGYEAFVQQRPLAAKPWYFLVPMTAVFNIGVPLRRGLAARYDLDRWRVPS